MLCMMIRLYLFLMFFVISCVLFVCVKCCIVFIVLNLSGLCVMLWMKKWLIFMMFGCRCSYRFMFVFVVL